MFNVDKLTNEMNLIEFSSRIQDQDFQRNQVNWMGAKLHVQELDTLTESCFQS